MTEIDRVRAFEAMAERISKNTGEEFGGAYVILPPGQDVTPMEFLALHKIDSAAMFFKILSSEIERKIEEIDQEDRRAQGYGR